MHKMIKTIMDMDLTCKEKNELLNLLLNDISDAKRVLNNGRKFCSACNDYYYEKSFVMEQVKTTEKFTHNSIPSFTSKYKQTEIEKDVEITYRVCPKGHKHIVEKVIYE